MSALPLLFALTAASNFAYLSAVLWKLGMTSPSTDASKPSSLAMNNPNALPVSPKTSALSAS